MDRGTADLEMNSKLDLNHVENNIQAHSLPKTSLGEVVGALDEHERVLIQCDSGTEAKIRRKIDFACVPMVSLMYLFCFIDVGQKISGPDDCTVISSMTNTFLLQRTNIGNARIAGIEKDLHLTGSGYNTVLSVFCGSSAILQLSDQ